MVPDFCRLNVISIDTNAINKWKMGSRS
jgi:hypothetical protein